MMVALRANPDNVLLNRLSSTDVSNAKLARKSDFVRPPEDDQVELSQNQQNQISADPVGSNESLFEDGPMIEGPVIEGPVIEGPAILPDEESSTETSIGSDSNQQFSILEPIEKTTEADPTTEVDPFK